MAKTDITIEQALGLIERISQELGLVRKETSGFHQVQGPTNQHRIYVQKARTLNRIDTTIELPSTLEDGAPNPMYRQLSAPNGSIKCHIVPTLEFLEQGLRMLGDGAIEKQVPNKPRPFAATKSPARKPRPVAAPVPEAALIPVIDGEKLELEVRLRRIHDRARLARVNRILDNPEQYGHMTREEAEAIVDGRVSTEDVRHRKSPALVDIEQEALGDADLEAALRNGREASA